MTGLLRTRTRPSLPKTLQDQVFHTIKTWEPMELLGVAAPALKDYLMTDLLEWAGEGTEELYQRIIATIMDKEVPRVKWMRFLHAVYGNASNRVIEDAVVLSVILVRRALVQVYWEVETRESGSSTNSTVAQERTVSTPSRLRGTSPDGQGSSPPSTSERSKAVVSQSGTNNQ